jgi:hypothetical protein
MANILVLTGIPGSGKSRAARFLNGEEVWPGYQREWHACLDGYQVKHITDYTFLHKWFLAEEQRGPVHGKQRYFRRTSYGGFDIMYPEIVLPYALQLVNAEASRYLQHEKTLILIEFARRDYYPSTWEPFHAEILRHAHHLHFRADIETCVQRVERRSRYQSYPDDQYVSKQVMRSYYQEDGLASLRQTRGEKRVTAINNSGEWSEACREIYRALAMTIERITVSSSPPCMVQDFAVLAKSGIAEKGSPSWKN